MLCWASPGTFVSTLESMGCLVSLPLLVLPLLLGQAVVRSFSRLNFLLRFFKLRTVEGGMSSARSARECSLRTGQIHRFMAFGTSLTIGCQLGR